ncbi:carbonic anhydrase family protein [Listeria booriae]|uniref:Carbonic anhydrase n=1 Tax=Listeria booriae TaxID=1552123 RepID=A0A841Y8X5_9LIST|nr:carbonic anhydrase family protein [Listeria booriae]MBC1373342.1 carbonic anhydrase family protein [Listeria booriae]
MKKQFLITSGLVASLVLVTGCGSNTEEKAKVEDKPKQEEHLDYKNQKSWQFESGKSQSPINIETNKTELMTDLGNIELKYNQTAIDEEDNGHSIQVGLSGQATINGRQFDLKQVHFHAKSEHTVNGQHYPIEAHFVNAGQDGRLAVIGVFFTEGKENPAFETVLSNVKKGEKVDLNTTLDIPALIPSNKTYYHYLGSLTTPPLAENIEWYVMENPIEVSKEQIATFNDYYDHNNREVQPLNGRPVLKHTDN